MSFPIRKQSMPNSGHLQRQELPFHRCGAGLCWMLHFLLPWLLVFLLPSTFKGFKLSRRTGGQENPTRWLPQAQSIRLSAFLLKGDRNCRDIEEIAKSLSVCNQLMRQRTASPAVASPHSAPVSLPHFPRTLTRAGGS